MITSGFTFLSQTPDYSTKHLYIIISIIDSVEALFVNVTSKKEKSDTSCILNIGDHDYLIRESVINYADAKITKIDNLRKAIDSRLITANKPVSNGLLKKIQKGALNSDIFPEGFKKHIPNISD